jgi:hypothetical protein
LVGCCVTLLWWVGALHFGFTSLDDLRGMGIDPGPLARIDLVHFKAVLFWPVLAYLILLISRYLLVVVGALSMMAEGLLFIASGAALLALITWIWQASPFGPFVRLDGLAAAVDFMDKHPGSDVLLAPLLSVLLICMGFGALGGIAKGLWLVVRAPVGERGY